MSGYANFAFALLFTIIALRGCVDRDRHDQILKRLDAIEDTCRR